MSKIILHFKYSPSRENPYPLCRVSPKEYRDNIEEMMRLAKNNGIKTLFLVRPAFYDPEKKVVFTNGYLPPGNILGFNVYAYFKQREKDATELFRDDARPLNFHLTVEGQKALAEAVFIFLLEHNVIDKGSTITDASSVKKNLQS